ncbi:MAG: MBL fold metallo-hydrolase [Euryarchaeota archaeon]|nr:MBL fold metallo-hydrolase [Euryarchaeota archaeon]
MEPVEIILLGSGGGRWVTIKQARYTGGIRLHNGIRLHIDPGPGALVRTYQFGLDPMKIDGVITSHCHPDHYTDAEVLIEAMTHGMTKKRGFLVANKTVLESVEGFGGPAISKYHQNLPKTKILMESGQKAKLENLEIEATPAKHSEPKTIGLKFYTSQGIVSSIFDSEYFNSLSEPYVGSKVLFLAVMRPFADRIPFHLCTEDAAKIIKEAKPELAVLTHFGMKMILQNPAKQAQWVEKETGSKTIAAEDGMVIKIDKEITISKVTPQKKLNFF